MMNYEMENEIIREEENEEEEENLNLDLAYDDYDDDSEEEYDDMAETEARVKSGLIGLGVLGVVGLVVGGVALAKKTKAKIAEHKSTKAAKANAEIELPKTKETKIIDVDFEKVDLPESEEPKEDKYPAKKKSKKTKAKVG